MKKRVVKKAQSQIIATVLIILLVLAAIVIIWQVYSSIIKEKTGEIEVDILKVQLKIEKVNINYDGGQLEVSVSRGSDNAEISSLKFVVQGDSVSKTYDISDNPIPPKALETVDYNFLNINDFDLTTNPIKKILVYPVSESGKLGIAAEYTVKGTEPTTITPGGTQHNPGGNGNGGPGSGDVCGDESCTGIEDCNNCESDCGICPPSDITCAGLSEGADCNIGGVPGTCDASGRCLRDELVDCWDFSCVDPASIWYSLISGSGWEFEAPANALFVPGTSGSEIQQELIGIIEGKKYLIEINVINLPIADTDNYLAYYFETSDGLPLEESKIIAPASNEKFFYEYTVPVGPDRDFKIEAYFNNPSFNAELNSVSVREIL